MQTTDEFHPSHLTTASQRGGYLSKPVSPLLAVASACVILAFIWMKILASPASVYASSIENASFSPLYQNDQIGSSLNANQNQQKTLSPIFTPEVMYWADRILVWSESAGLDPNLVAAVMQIESCGDPLALSRSGAMGLFQVMPYHFTDAENPYDPETNANRGLNYLQRSLQAGDHSPRLALAGYNGGIGVIGLPESGWPSQTQRYVYWGTGIVDDAGRGLTESPWLQDWYQTSGVSLCRQAHDRLGLLP
jgi:soluble lytic murein transglycosylase-like protein